MSAVSAPAGQVMASAPVLELLEWVALAPRTYEDAMEAWRSHCPRLTVWEDAIVDGLIVIRQTHTPVRRSLVVLTPRGRSAIAAASPAIR